MSSSHSLWVSTITDWSFSFICLKQVIVQNNYVTEHYFLSINCNYLKSTFYRESHLNDWVQFNSKS